LTDFSDFYQSQSKTERSCSCYQLVQRIDGFFGFSYQSQSKKSISCTCYQLVQRIDGFFGFSSYKSQFKNEGKKLYYLITIRNIRKEVVLSLVLLGRLISMREFLPRAIQIADSLGQIHTANVIHKDINPANIVWNQATNKIIDFGIATVLPRENPTLKNQLFRV
jgi:serine/threonine protein kinase